MSDLLIMCSPPLAQQALPNTCIRDTTQDATAGFTIQKLSSTTSAHTGSKYAAYICGKRWRRFASGNEALHGPGYITELRHCLYSPHVGLACKSRAPSSATFHAGSPPTRLCKLLLCSRRACTYATRAIRSRHSSFAAHDRFSRS